MTRPAPAFILGGLRSGMLLKSRILGLPDGYYLITDHKNKDACRVDHLGINESKLWRNTSEIDGWNEERDRPAIEEPIYGAGSLQRLKSIYENLACNNRLIVKYPSNLVRISLIKEMFPDAIFLFYNRNPWQTITSIARKGVSGEPARESFRQRTKILSDLANDFLLRALHSWAESLRMHLKHRDNYWLSVRYEGVEANPEKEIGRLNAELCIDDPESLRKAVSFPRHGAKSCYAINQAYISSPHRQKMDELLQENAPAFGYASDSNSLNISRLSFYREKFTRKQIKRYLNRFAGDVVDRLRITTAG